MNHYLIALFLLVSISAISQKNSDEEVQSIIEEGTLLYRSEMASWYGTDLFLENYAQRENIGGYFSYSESDSSRCVFFSKTETPVVIGTISFDENYQVTSANTDLTERQFTTTEYDLYQIRKLTLAEMNSDTLFKSYQNTNLNLIPLINGTEKKVYVLTGPQQQGVVIFGNDYLLTFDESNALTSKKALHKNILPIYYGDEEDKDSQAVGAMHSHLPETGDLITATDICTLMLYSKFAKWKTHQVVSENYISSWNCETNQLIVITREEKKSKKRGKK